MKIRTELRFPSYPFKISYQDNILSLGSCFSDNIAHKLSHLKYNLIQNPSGITFNPSSLLTTIKSIIEPNSLLQESFFLNNGLWSHADFHGSFSHPDRSTAYKTAQASLKAAHQALPHITKVFLTIGTSHVFRAIDTGRIVNNCHKRPGDHFKKEILTPQKIVNLITESLDLLQLQNNGDIQFVLTVSPIRHLKNGVIADKLNKARCLLAVHEIIAERSDSHYFPSYEIMMDDLRDYRYYADDLIHPSAQAVNYIFDRFEKNLLSTDEIDLRSRVSQINNQLNHKPLFPDSEAHQKFLIQLDKATKKLKEDYPILEGRI